MEASNNKPVYIVKKRSNGLGTAGFVLSVIALVLGWVPFFGWILCGLGCIFSFIGIFKAPRGLAIAGTIISVININLILFLYTMLFTAIGIADYESILYSV
ncbi:MAG TPA: hypothetical protein IAC03_02145 [Candidatus Coprenecus pullistercoris]|nr:hypothetical protein [Candidatus Coprenecus pullistercoris]